MDVMPVVPAVAGFPCQVPGSGIHNVRIFGIDGDGFDVLDYTVVRRNPLPIVAAIVAAVNAIEGASNYHLIVGSRYCHGAHRFAMHPRQSLPVLAAVASAENVACVLILHAPGGDENS